MAIKTDLNEHPHAAAQTDYFSRCFYIFKKLICQFEFFALLCNIAGSNIASAASCAGNSLSQISAELKP